MGKLQYALILAIAGGFLLFRSWDQIGPLFNSKPLPVIADTPLAFSVDKRKKVTVWYYTQYEETGTIYSSGPPDGISVEVLGSEGSLSLKTDRSTTVSVMGQERKSLFSGWAEDPGDYQLIVKHTGGPLRLVVTVGSGILEIMRGFAVASLGMMLLVVAGVLALLGFSEPPKAPPPSPWDRVNK